MGVYAELPNDKPRVAAWEFMPGWIRAGVNYSIVAIALLLFLTQSVGSVPDDVREQVRSIGLTVFVVLGSVYIPFGAPFVRRRRAGAGELG